MKIINSRVLKVGLAGAAILALIAPPAFAAGFPYWGPVVSCTGGAPEAGMSVQKQCTNLCDLFQTGQNVIYLMMTVAVLALAPIFILWGAILIMTMGGSTERVESGRHIITSTVIGVLIALGAFVIVNTFILIMGNVSGSTTGLWKNWSNLSCGAAQSSAQ